MTNRYRIAIAGGGTGGHLYPGLAIADFFRNQYPGSEIIFFGTARGVECKIVPRQDYKLYLLPVRGLQRKVSLQNVLFPIRLLWSVVKSWFILQRFKPQLVIGTGGYVAGPPLIAANLLGIKTAIQEQNSFPGLVNRKLGTRVNLVFAAFADSQKYFAGQKQFYLTGNPVRLRNLLETKESAMRGFNLQANKLTILIFGGSQGAQRINEVVADILPELLADDNIQVIWVVGPAAENKWDNWQEKYPERLRVCGYVENMTLAYKIADIAVCRAGAMTLSELALFGLPAVLIPFPWATANHQTRNAQSVVQAGAGVLINEDELTKDRLKDVLQKLIKDADYRHGMQEKSLALAKPNATEEIVQHCIQTIEN